MKFNLKTIGYLFIGFMIMLILTKGQPSELVLTLTVVLGIIFVIIQEVKKNER